MRFAACELRAVRWQLGAAGPAIWQRTAALRSGTLLRLRSAEADGGHVGLGEASPLDGDDGAEAAGSELARFAAFVLEAAPAERDVRAFAAALSSAAARFAIETALLSALAAARGLSLASALRAEPPPAARAPINAVVDSALAARAAHRRGITTFKLKLGADTAADARLLQELRAALGAEGDRVQLRGDANRSWPEAEVAARLALLAPARLAYIEEPCRDLAAALAAAETTGQQIALDESLAELPLDRLEAHLAHPRVAALILKPSRLGLLGALARLELAQRHGKPAVVTHALEGPIGTAACAELARVAAATAATGAPGAPPLAAGLDAHPALTAWTVAVPQHAALDRGELCAAAESGLGLEAQWSQLCP